MILVIFFLFIPPNISYAGTSFGATIDLQSATAVNAKTPRIASSGNNVFVVTQEDSDVFFTRSTDGGANFDTPINLSNSGGVTLLQHQLVIASDAIYVLWREVNDILITKSTNNGVSFGSVDNLSNSGTTSRNPQITTSGSNVYAAWREGGSNSDIFFAKTIDATTSFGTPINLSNSATTRSQEPQLSASGSDVYVVWREGKTNSDISIISSSDNAVNFGGITNLSNSATTTSQSPQIESSSNGVYVAWQEGVKVFFIKSTANNTPFDAAIDLGSIGVDPHQRIGVFETSIFIAWQKGNDINFRRSIDNGDTFEAEINLSQTSGTSSSLPEIGVSGSNIFVVWREGNLASDDKDVHFKSSSSSGANFGGLNDLGNNALHSNEPQLAASSNNVYVVWSEETTQNIGDGKIKFRAGAVTSTDVEFVDSPAQYRVTDSFSDTATIRVTDNSFSGSVSVDITSTSDPAPGGISVDLAETGIGTGIFEGTITFTTGSSDDENDILKAAAGNTITASFNGVNGVGLIFPRTIEFLLPGFGVANDFDYGEIVNIRVTDENFNTDPNNLDPPISVNVKSIRDSTGISLSLAETDIDDGIFIGTLIFMDKNPSDLLFPTSGTVTVSSLGNTEVPPITASITSTTDTSNGKSGITLTLSETDVPTDFTGTLTLTTSDSDQASGSIEVAEGDIVSVTTVLQGVSLTSNALVTPHPDTINAISVNFPDGDTVIATFEGVTTNVSVHDTIIPGGGGGGLVRPGLVVNILAGASIFSGGGGKGPSQPTFGDVLMTSLEVTSDGLGGIIESEESSLEHTNVVKTGDMQVFRFDLYENGGINNLEHVSVYLNLRGEDFTIEDSDTFVTWEKNKPLVVNDPNGFFADVDFNVSQKDDAYNLVLNFKVIFAKPMETSHIVLRSWDLDRWSSDLELVDALKVVDPESLESDILSEESALGPTEVVAEAQKIPIWVRNNANWWSEDQIDDSDFVAGMQYLINKKIMIIPETKAADFSGETFMPDWIKNNAGWWSEGLITDDDFVKGMQWLISNGIIKV